MNYFPYKSQNIKRYLNENKLYLSKNRGQNYLVSEDIALQIVSFTPDNLPFLEVGTGLGALTIPLLKKQKTVSFEIDEGIYNFVSPHLLDPNFSFLCSDFLKYDLSQLKEDKYFFVSNTPYSISGEIIKNFISDGHFEDAVLMLQKEFFDRMNASPKNKNYTLLSVLCQIFLDFEILMKVSKTFFFPVPKVDSLVVSLHKKNITLDQDSFKDFLFIFFKGKRKTISHSFKKEFKKELPNIFKDLENKRPDEISPQVWLDFYQKYYSFSNPGSC